MHRELDEIFGDSTEPATMKQLAQLNYLDRVIKENLRLNPPVPRFGRRLTENIELGTKYITLKGVVYIYLAFFHNFFFIIKVISVH